MTAHSTMDPAHGYFEGLGRLRLHYRAWEAPDPRAALILVHGLFEHSRRYQELGEFMVARGLSTYALDLRGHGLSDGRRGHARRFATLLQDLDRFRHEVQGLAPDGVPLFLVAHSMGGLLALRYLEEYHSPIAGAVITAPWLATAVRTPRWMVLAATVLDRILPAFPFRYRLDPRTLSHDQARTADYTQDPEIHSIITPRMFTEVSAAMSLALQRGDRIRVPVHFLLAGDDRIVDTPRTLAFARSLPGDRFTVEVLDGLFHEVLQEKGREAVMRKIHDWLDQRLG